MSKCDVMSALTYVIRGYRLKQHLVGGALLEVPILSR